MSKEEVYGGGTPCLGCSRTHMWLVDGLCADCRVRDVENSANLYLPTGQSKMYCAACGERLMSMQQEHHCKPEVKSDAQRIDDLTKRVEALERPEACPMCGEKVLGSLDDHHCRVVDAERTDERIDELTRRVEALENAIQELRDNGRIQDGESR